MNRTKITAHYKKFHNLDRIGEENQLDIDWAESLLKEFKKEVGEFFNGNGDPYDLMGDDLNDGWSIDDQL